MLSAPPITLAVCREPLNDGNEWSIYVLNEDTQRSIEVVVEEVAFEWGNVGHSQVPGTRVVLPAHGSARVCRVDGDDAELSMTLTVGIAAGSKDWRASFELGKLYRYRDPKPINSLGVAGWLRSANDCRAQ